MEDFDNQQNSTSSGLGSLEDEDLIMENVVGDDHELLYLDSFLKDVFHDGQK